MPLLMIPFFLCLSLYIIMDALQLYRAPLGFQAQAYKFQVCAPQHVCMAKLVMAQGYPLHWSITQKDKTISTLLGN